jgi:hypothetical protein
VATEAVMHGCANSLREPRKASLATPVLCVDERRDAQKVSVRRVAFLTAG